jgi:hypothetical protein
MIFIEPNLYRLPQSDRGCRATIHPSRFLIFTDAWPLNIPVACWANTKTAIGEELDKRNFDSGFS